MIADKSELENSPLTSDLDVVRPIDPAQIGLSLNTMLIQIDMNREVAQVRSQEISIVQDGMRYIIFVMQVSQTR